MLLLSPSPSSTPLLLLQARPLCGGGQRQPEDAAASSQGCRETPAEDGDPKAGREQMGHKVMLGPSP